MITGIPSYSDRPFQSLRCVCGLRFVALTDDRQQDEQKARAQALRKAEFIDGRRLLSFQCYCGADLDISPEGSLTVQ